ncbi:GNAT family N-acetyltransferase [Nitrosomonas sp.]|uniref:GNAT family N-acetyltransferase n=1 Tax=Nitrosomonas sp. TaxID=42353 RepID=UPI003527CC82
MQVRLATHEARHAQPIYEAVRESISEVSPWMPWCHAEYGLSDAEAWVQAASEAFQDRTSFEFVIESSDSRVLGCGGLNQIDSLNHRCNLGYWVRTSETRRGVATSAVRALAAWAFRETELVRLELTIANENGGSRRVAEKAGARQEGSLRSRLFLRGRHHDAALYSIVRGDTHVA